MINKKQDQHWVECMRFPWLVAGLALLILCMPVSGQVATGSLGGTVADSSGAVIAGAHVKLVDEATNLSRETVSNGVGYFSFGAVQPGSYTVIITAPGFKLWLRKGVTFNQAENRSFSSITLTPGTNVETVEVSADMSAVPVDTPESRMTLTTQTITDTAIQGRNASELIKIMPGMAFNRGLNNSAWTSLTTATNSGPIGQYSASGTQPYGSITMTSDGANILDIGNMGTQVANINQDQTAEVTILNSTFGAEFAKGPEPSRRLVRAAPRIFMDPAICTRVMACSTRTSGTRNTTICAATNLISRMTATTILASPWVVL